MYNLKGGYQRYFRALAFIVCLSLFGCAAPISAPLTSAVVPGNTASASFQVHEYALVEESADNPTHVEFQQRVPAAVASQRASWLFAHTGDVVQSENQALAPFGYHLETNPTPPFSGYALYHGKDLIQRNIARVWPVLVKDADNKEGVGDFQLSFETMAGEKLIANTTGVHPSPDQDQSAGSTLPANLGNQVAYADSVRSDVSLYTGSIPADSRSGSNGLEFGRQMVAGQPFFFYNRGGLIHLNYAGHDLSYTYDKVVHDNTGSTTIFNPGGSGRVAWFYALRDGLWYYVEVGVFE